jgi:two-component system OmpR family response regulator
MSYRLVIVEDDLDQQQNYADALERRGFETQCFSNVHDAIAGIKASKPDLVLLDVVLGDDPDGGFTICRRLLDQGDDLPIIFLTDRSDEIDQVFGLRLGAWDYQTKPISLSLLAERITSLLRIHKARTQSSASPSSRENTTENAPSQTTTQTLDGPLSIDEQKSFVAWHGKTVALTLTEFRILYAIRESGAGGIGYQELSESTMQRHVTNGTITSHIKNIRKKMNAVAGEFNHIHNKPGFGYRWEAP